jgi:hypothetical protein
MQVDIQKEKKGKTLSRILRIDQSEYPKSSSSSPDIKLIKNLKERIDTDNPLFKFSMEDYENMCKNKVLFNIMVRVLDTDKKKLTKICKYIHILKKYINSSPESIKNKIKIKKMSILDLPDNVLSNIVSKYQNILEYKLRVWIPINKLHWDKLSLNINAIDLLRGRIEYEKKLISENKYYILKRECDRINWSNLSKNPNAIDLLEKKWVDEKKNEYFTFFIKIDWDNLSENINAIDLLEKKWEEEKNLMKEGKYNSLRSSEKINWAKISENINAIDLLEKKWEEEKNLMKEGNYRSLRSNEKINWGDISNNINAINLLREKIKQEEILLENGEYNSLTYDERINWSNLSKNSGAIDLLYENKKKINWKYFSSNLNPKAYDLLMEQMEYENKLSKYELYNLKNSISISDLSKSQNPAAIKVLQKYFDRIEWGNLSYNPYAINLLIENPKRIQWLGFSKNTDPQAIDLLRKRWAYEKHLKKYDIEEYKKPYIYMNRIDWGYLSENINAINLLRDKFHEEEEDRILSKKECIKECIDWAKISENPSIFILN